MKYMCVFLKLVILVMFFCVEIQHLRCIHCFVCAGAADKGQDQKQDPAGAQERISNQVSLSTRQKVKLCDAELLH